MSLESVRRVLGAQFVHAINSRNNFPGEELWRLNVERAMWHHKISVLLVEGRLNTGLTRAQREDLFREVFAAVQAEHPEIRTGREPVVAAGR